LTNTLIAYIIISETKTETPTGRRYIMSIFEVGKFYAFNLDKAYTDIFDYSGKVEYYMCDSITKIDDLYKVHFTTYNGSWRVPFLLEKSLDVRAAWNEISAEEYQQKADEYRREQEEHDRIQAEKELRNAEAEAWFTAHPELDYGFGKE
jgi:hypothetical protein